QPLGVVVQFGGQTPLKLAVPLRDAGVPILGTSPDAIDPAEERPRRTPLGAAVQFGGQPPLKLAVPLRDAGVPILGTSPDAIDRAEDRQRFSALLTELGLRQAAGATARSLDEARVIAAKIGYPVLVRPSYVLGGRAMRIVHDDQDLAEFMQEAVPASPENPVLVAKFLGDAVGRGG